MEKPATIHPLGTNAKVLLASVFGPYAQDNEYGSRKINPMELYHNQVTRVQGPFSLRMSARSFGLMLIKENIEAPCTLLDFPTLDRFTEEIKTQKYDVVGISSIATNYLKVSKMCQVVRKYSPNTTIVIGGHIANSIGFYGPIDADHIVKGDGVRWFREFLGQDLDAPVKHPMVRAVFGVKIFGMPFPAEERKIGNVTPSVGCPVGCNFCCTSHMFGGKGKFVNFYETGDELYSVMEEMEKKLKVNSYFILDENFLLHRERALRLMELMEGNNKSWSLYVFSSARVIRSYSIDQLIRLGIHWIWIGLEGEGSQYSKLDDISTKSLVKELQSHGINILGSSIIGLEDHTPDNIDKVIDWAVSHETDLHQFMLYMPAPGTPFFEDCLKKGIISDNDENSLPDVHGQYRFNYRHEHIKDGQEEEFLLRAFKRDFEYNGPSIVRMMKTTFKGWKRYKGHHDPRVRRRFKNEVSSFPCLGTGGVWGARKWYKNDEEMFRKIDSVLREMCNEFGWITRILTPVVGIFSYYILKFENMRLKKGWVYEPPTFYEKNREMKELERREFWGTVKRVLGLSKAA